MNARDRDSYFMNCALSLAKKAELHGEVPVGAVVVLEGKVIGEGWNQPICSNDCTAHAEVIALREASSVMENYRLPGAELYVTLEPCLMCVGAMVHARIERLVFGAYDAKSGVCGPRFNAFEIDGLNHRVQCDGGVLADVCGALLQNFFKAKR